MNNQKSTPKKPETQLTTNETTKRSIEFASVKSKDGVSEPSIKLDINDKESEFVEYEVNEMEEEKAQPKQGKDDKKPQVNGESRHRPANEERREKAAHSPIDQ